MGCFKGANDLTELGDLTGEEKWYNTNEAVRKCARLTRQEGLELFALGKGGVCLSGQDMKNIYLDSGSENIQCHNGIGFGDSMFVYSLSKHCLFVLKGFVQNMIISPDISWQCCDILLQESMKGKRGHPQYRPYPQGNHSQVIIRTE